MSHQEYQTTINWDDMALVRPISAPGIPSITGGTAIALESSAEFPVTINWDELALVRPISATSSPFFAAGAGVALESAGVPFSENVLIKDLLIKLGEAKDLKIFAIERSGAIGSEIGIASIADLPDGPYQVIGIEGGPNTAEGSGTFLLSSPNGEWEAILIQSGVLAGGGASVTVAEGGPEAHAGYGTYLSGFDVEIIPVGFSGVEMALL